MATVSQPPPQRSSRPRPHPTEPAAAAPRISLVVDHAVRDLPGMVLTGLELCRRGATCYLTPFNLVDIEIWRQSPDFVLLNYYRKNFRSFYEPLAAAGIGIGVLDTEGGVMANLQSFTNDLIEDRELLQAVSCYCCWGPVVADHLVECQLLSPQQVTVTGCPRTDFYAQHLSECVRDRSRSLLPDSGELILLNSNFSIGNPAYLSDEQQTRLLVNDLGHSPDEVQLWQQREKAGLKQLAEIANTLAKRFPQAVVVFRPHPFERLETYDELLQKRENLHCLRTGTADAWLALASVVIQRSCSTSIEAGMAGKAALSPTWVETSFERPAANRTSVPCPTPEALCDRVAEVLAGTFQMPAQVRDDYEAVIRDWFYQVDGRAHQRVAEAILDCVNAEEAPRLRRRAASRRQAFGLNRGLLSRKRWRGQLKSVLGLPPSWSFGRWQDEPLHPERFDSWRSSAKYFDPAMVQQITSAVNDSLGTAAIPVEVTPADRAEDRLFGYRQACAVKMTPGRGARRGQAS